INGVNSLEVQFHDLSGSILAGFHRFLQLTDRGLVQGKIVAEACRSFGVEITSIQNDGGKYQCCEIRVTSEVSAVNRYGGWIIERNAYGNVRKIGRVGNLTCCAEVRTCMF